MSDLTTEKAKVEAAVAATASADEAVAKSFLAKQLAWVKAHGVPLAVGAVLGALAARLV